MLWLRHQLHRLVQEVGSTLQADSLAQTVQGLSRAKPRLYGVLRRSLRDEVAAKGLTVKLLNLVLARRHFAVRDVELISRPPGLVVDTSNVCNLACPGCVHSERAKELRLFDWKPGMLSGNCFAAFLRRYGPTAIYAMLCNYGEPLVNRETPKLIRTAKRYLLHTAISTNMTLPGFDAAAYADSGLDYMVVSADGATQPVYQRFRRKGDLEQVFRNVRRLVAARGRRRTPVLAWRFLAFQHNVHEIPAAMEKARELGFDEFRAEPAWDIAWDDATIRPAAIDPVRVEFRPRLFDGLAMNWNPFPKELDAESIEQDFEREWVAESGGSVAVASGSSCEWLYKGLTMDAGARIFPCCCAPTSKKDLHFATFDAAGPDQSFNSEKHRMARQFFADPAAYWSHHDAAGPERNPYCTRCEWDKTADPSPDHIRQYFASAAPALFTRRTLDLLAW